jgi:P27 family predicted phage terminase small subunit
MKGRIPKPTTVKVLQGNPGKRALPKNEVKPVVGVPEPAGISNAAALDIYNDMAPRLKRLGLLTELDGSTLVRLCNCMMRYQQAEVDIEERGVTLQEPVLSRDGNLVGHRYKKNPSLITSVAMLKEIRSLSSLFGLSPADRARVHPTEEGDNFSFGLDALNRGFDDLRKAN